MRALMLQEASGPSGLALVETDEPKAPEGFVAIDVHATGVGFVDMLISKGEYQIKPPLPFIPGNEVAGTIRSAPEGSGFAVGDRVCATTPFGGWAEVA
ncbi:MAG: alcohol dehydrogenase catalytic domain-containing protein, partial [Solirubrobacterales bacterium]|nr:alcohol dehydrogenase catalytic domain-containing protein [Solirubrobacterales bacterium]